MQLVDARRLMGPSLLGRSPLVVVELAFDDEAEHAPGRAAYLGELARMRSALGLSPEVRSVERRHTRGTVLGYVEPIDVMLACAEMSEWAALSACELVASRPALPLEPRRAEVAAMLERDRSPRLLALQAEARRRGLPFLWDDACVSVGMGVRSATWARTALPDARDVEWDALGAIPVALVTGTNGKTTSTRLLARMAREAGVRVGSTSSDAIMIGADVVEEGDWTGPAAARAVLQRADVELAVLETARGGILRRGLAIDACDVALVTNVSDDHLGGYGVEDLDAMAQVKGVIVEALAPGGTAVLNAGDPRLVALAAGRPRVTFFADLEGAPEGRDEARAVIDRHRASGGEALFTSSGQIVRAHGADASVLASVASIPIAMGGAARFNVENALGALAAAYALGLSDDAVSRALHGFSAADNPRRSTLVERGDARVLLDFAHNAEGVRAALRMVRELRASRPGRLTVVTGCAGDRSDRELEEIARAIHEARPDRVLVRDLPDYLRGRAPGEVPELFRRAFLAKGMAPDAIAIVASEVDALRLALAAPTPGDFVVLLVHLEHDDVRAFLTD